MSTRDLGTGSLLSTFSVGRTRLVERWGGGCWSRCGEWRRRAEYDKAETHPQVPVGTTGTTAVIPPHCTAADFFYPLSSPSCSVFCLFISDFSSPHYFTVSSRCLGFLKHTVISRGHQGLPLPVSFIFLSFFLKGWCDILLAKRSVKLILAPECWAV